MARARAQVLHHLNPDEGRVFRRPRPGRVPQNAKFHRQPITMRLNVSVHTPRVSFETRAILGRQSFYRFSSNDFEPEDSLLSIVLQVIVAEHFRQLSRRKPSHSVHLEQSVLRSYVTLSEKEIIEVSGIDRGRSVPIANNLYWRRKARHSKPAVHLW